jgi:hypothetical protein
MSFPLTAAPVALVKINEARVEAASDRDTRFDTRITTLKCCLAAFSLLMADLLSLSAVAQITQPLQPFQVPINLPQLPAVGEQQVPLGETVTSRPRPEFDPLGLHFDNFFWFPRAELDESYNSNIFATTTSPTYDFITALVPGFDLLSNFSRSAFNLHGSAVLQDYADHPAQNTQTGSISADGRYDITAGSSLFANAQVGHQYISYGSPNSPGNIAQPVTYWDYIARAGYLQGGRRFSYGVDVGVWAAQYNAAPLVGGGVLPQSSQDAAIYDAAVRANYEIVPDYLGWIRLDTAFYDSWHAVSSNSTTTRVDLGLQIRPRHLIYGEAYIGYLVQNSTMSNVSSTSVPDFGGRLVWNITPLTTFTFTGLRTFITGNVTSTTVGVPGPAGTGYLATTIVANADHELLRNLLLNLTTSFENDSFQGITRTDNVFGAGAGFTYLVNRHLYLGGYFNYYQRNSTAPGSSYTQNILALRVGTRF